MTVYLGEEFLLLLLPTKLVIGRPHLRGWPRRPCHSVDLSVSLLVLGLWLSLVSWDQRDLTMPDGGLAPHLASGRSHLA